MEKAQDFGGYYIELSSAVVELGLDDGTLVVLDGRLMTHDRACELAEMNDFQF